MIFDIYYPFTNKQGVLCPGIKPVPMKWEDVLKVADSDKVKSVIAAIRAEEDEKKQGELKKQLPAICYVGRCQGTRAASNMTPTQLVMIDIDHVEDPARAWHLLHERMKTYWLDELPKNLMCAHLTPRQGIRIVFVAQMLGTLQENMEWFNTTFNAGEFGKFDAPCKDFSRISFMFQKTELLYDSTALYLESDILSDVERLSNLYFDPKGAGSKSSEVKAESILADMTDKEREEFENYEYRGTPVKTIIEKYVEVNGKPGTGEIHNYYNDMVKNFRNITSNNKRYLLYALPRFGHSEDECWSSIVSICKVNTLSSLPKPFYFFLKDNGFYVAKSPNGELANYMMSDNKEEVVDDMPWLPPVFREFIRITPKDFRVSVINSLLPIMGTLTSYLQGKYYWDHDFHTTSFFSIIYAPAGTGKSFPTRFMDLLFEMIKIRDYVQQARENIYLDTINRKSQSEQSPENPYTSLRIIPPKNSETEFLEKMNNNKGYHMFTYAAEMDSWAKGVKAAGGNKDDMIRIAWDNQEYGQQFKSTATFKGKVRLFWNVLITGTIEQLMAYFKNVENGLVTRCSFTTIENQEFAPPAVWKELNKKELSTIRKFVERCDANTYESPCTLMPEDVDIVPRNKFDEEIDWRFKFRPKKTVDMEWLRPTIEEFTNEQLKKAAVDYDKARDVFRRRVAVRGFRLGIMCYALWENPRKSDLEKCIPFIKWWMEQDIESILALWGAKYNNAVETTPNLTQRSLFNQLGDTFTKNDVFTACMRQGIKTPIRNIVYAWIKLGVVEKVAKNDYKKIKK